MTSTLQVAMFILMKSAAPWRDRVVAYTGSGRDLGWRLLRLADPTQPLAQHIIGRLQIRDTCPFITLVCLR